MRTDRSMFWSDRFRSAKSFVYCIIHHESKSVKIGVTNDPERRFAQIQTGSPHSLTLHSFMPGDRATEAAFHRKFADRRKVGEWFSDPDRRITSLFGQMSFRARMRG